MSTKESKIIEGIKIIDLKINEDERGYLFESYQKFKDFKNLNFCQDNIVKSKFGVIRGMHYQLKPYAQSKLITVIEGSIQDVVIDLRQSSKTFGSYFSVKISDKDNKQIYIPHGFAHGFLTLSSFSLVHYKLDCPYNPKYESSIKFNDSKVGINWDINMDNVIVSAKDFKGIEFTNATYF